MGVFSRSWQLTKTSFRIVKEEKELIVFPILSTIFSILLVLVFVVPFLLTSITGNITDFTSIQIFEYVLIFVIYLGLAFIATFFNVCVVYTAAKKFSGGDPKFKSTIKFAFSKVHLIFLWSLVSATVGLLLTLLERAAEKTKGLGRIFLLVTRSLFGMAWSISTIFVIPAMVYHNLGPFAAIRKSVQTLKKTWGETIITSMGMGLISFIIILIEVILTVIMVIILAPLGFLPIVIAIILGVLTIILTAVIFGVAEKVFQTALYVYAETGVVVKGFDKESLKGSFKKKEKSMLNI